MIFHIEDFNMDLTINGKQSSYILDGTVDVEFGTEDDAHYIESVEIIKMTAGDDSESGYFAYDVTYLDGLVEKILDAQEDDFLESYEEENPTGCPCGNYCNTCV